MVFNSHYYDGARMTLDPTAASDGTYDAAMNEIRQRAADLGTAPLVSEFGNKMSDSRTPWMIRAMYQAMDYGVPGKNWWSAPASGGQVLSSMQWHWDIYSGRHHELMNGNPDKVQTEGDGWNDEDHSRRRRGVPRRRPSPPFCKGASTAFSSGVQRVRAHRPNCTCRTPSLRPARPL